MPERDIYRYSLDVKGLYGRNRTVKTESFTVCEVDRSAPKSLEELKPLVTAKLGEIKLKGGIVILWEVPLSIEEKGGMQSVRFGLGSGKELHRERVDGGGLRFQPCKLIIESLHDAQARCACGGWLFVRAGAATTQELADVHAQHAKPASPPSG